MEQLCWLTQLMSRKILSQWSRKLVRRESRSFAVVQLLNWMLSSQKWMAACRSNLLNLTLVLYYSTLSQKAALIPTSPFFQSLLSQQGKWMNSRLDSQKFYAATKDGPGASGALYYGFGVAGDSVYCREGFKDAEAAAKHGADIKPIIEEPIKAVGAGNMRLNVVGPAAELEKLKPKLAPRGAVFWELDSEAFWM